MVSHTHPTVENYLNRRRNSTFVVSQGLQCDEGTPEEEDDGDEEGHAWHARGLQLLAGGSAVRVVANFFGQNSIVFGCNGINLCK